MQNTALFIHFLKTGARQHSRTQNERRTPSCTRKIGIKQHLNLKLLYNSIYAFYFLSCLNFLCCMCVKYAYVRTLVSASNFMSYKFNIIAIFSSMNIIMHYLILRAFGVIENYVLFKFCKAAVISSYCYLLHTHRPTYTHSHRHMHEL